jgi:hypothetical protein
LARRRCANHLGSLTAENIGWNTKTITYFRRKTGKPCMLRFGEEAAASADERLTRGPSAREAAAQEGLGHASAAVYRTYAKSVWVQSPPLEEYEKTKAAPLSKAA